MLVEECMSSNFKLLPASLSPTAAALKLAPGVYGVVVGEDGAPVSLITAEDLRRAALLGGATLGEPEVMFPPTVVVGRSVKLSQLRKPLLVRFFGLGSHGAVVVGDSDKVVGVLGFDVLLLTPLEEEEESDAYWANYFQLTNNYFATFSTINEVELGAVLVGVSALGGSHTTPYGKVKCRACGYDNTVPFLDDAHLPACQNPAIPAHPLGV